MEKTRFRIYIKFAVNLIKKINQENFIHAEYFIQCPEHIKKVLKKDLQNFKSNITVKKYFNNIDDILKETSSNF